MALRQRPKRFCTSLLSTSVQAVYTADADTTGVVESANLVNNSATEQTYTIWATEGGSPADANLQTPSTYAIAANTRKDLSEILGLTVEAGSAIYAQAGADNVLTLTISGVEFVES
jgi:hypothetical protein